MTPDTPPPASDAGAHATRVRAADRTRAACATAILTRPLRDIVAFWSAPLPAEPLAAFRILIGLCLFLSIALTFLPRIRDFAGEQGLCPLAACEPWFDRRDAYEAVNDFETPAINRSCVLRGPQHIPWLEHQFTDDQKAAWRAWGDRPRNVWLLTLVWLGAIALMTAGLVTRPATFVVWVLTISFHNRFSWVLNGGDALSRIAVFYLLISPCARVWSLDALLRHRRRERHGLPDEGPALVPAWTVRLPQIQIAVVYLCTGLYKVWSDGWGRDWLDGTAVYWLLNDVALTRFPYHAVPVPLWLCKLLSWGTIGFELGFPLLVMCRWTRPAMLIGGVLFHLGVLATVEVGWFSMVSVAWYPLFLKGETLRRFRRWLFKAKEAPGAG
jgi:hypothetical protein